MVVFSALMVFSKNELLVIITGIYYLLKYVEFSDFVFYWILIL